MPGPFGTKHVTVVALAALSFNGCGNKAANVQPNTQSKVGTASTPASFTPRLGIGVRTPSRICMAIHNGDLASGSEVTLIFPIVPVTVVQGKVANVAKDPCPISQNLDTTVSNYALDVTPPVPTLTPFFVVLGTPIVTVNTSHIAQADLDQNGHTETFRACSGDDGIHLTVWDAVPLRGTLLWHAHYYAPSNPGVGPSCTPAELPAS